MSTKITKATLTNFQRVSYAEIIPSGNLIVLAGKNRAGKTTTNEAIEAALCGHDSKVIRRPIHDGAGKGSIVIELSDGSTIIRGYSQSGASTLRGTDAAGKKFGQTEINKRLSSLGIDGRKFIGLGDKKQLETLLSIVDLPFDPAELDAKRKAVEAERLSVGQQGKAIGDVVVDSALPTEETSAGEIITAIRAAEDAKREHANCAENAETAAFAVSSLTEQLAELTKKLADATEWSESASAKLAALPLPTDTTALESQLAAVEESNAAIRANNTARQKLAEKETLRAKWNKLDAELANIDQTKREALAAASANMPIEGLTFDDEGVLYEGKPFSRASGRDQLIVSCAMIMATDPEIRVIVVRDGNVLDTEGMGLLRDMAEATDFMIFIEIVKEERGDEEEFYFEDGKLAS